MSESSFSARSFGRAILQALIVLVGLGSAICVADEYKIGVINTERILREAAPAKEAARKIEQEFQSRDAALTKQEQELRDLVSRAERDAMTTAEGERNARQRDIELRGREIERQRRQLAEDLKTRQFDEMTRIKERLDAVLTKLAKDQGYDLILQDGVYVGRSVDITDAVIKAFEGR
ncbi:MAG TPA: OmpH family outer membrane protein [Casimicrobiaceae bacterium]|jgi:outer membrane protein